MSAPRAVSGLDEHGRIERLLVSHAADAFRSPLAIAAEWRELAFTAPRTSSARSRSRSVSWRR